MKNIEMSSKQRFKHVDPFMQDFLFFNIYFYSDNNKMNEIYAVGRRILNKLNNNAKRNFFHVQQTLCRRFYSFYCWYAVIVVVVAVTVTV